MRLSGGDLRAESQERRITPSKWPQGHLTDAVHCLTQQKHIDVTITISENAQGLDESAGDRVKPQLQILTILPAADCPAMRATAVAPCVADKPKRFVA